MKYFVLFLVFSSIQLSAYAQQAEVSATNSVTNSPPGFVDKVNGKLKAAQDAIQEDWKKIGTWDYKVERFADSLPADLEVTMNGLGKDGWECILATPDKAGFVLIFKKPGKSYIKTVIERK